MIDPAFDEAALRALIGQTLQDRYRIDALLGSGGMGAVFRAHHSGLGHDVAVKVLLPHVRGGEIATARFRREARSASRLEHPNCVRVMDFGALEDGTKFLVMQLVSGEELKRRLGTAWPPLAAIDVGMQILAGLAHAHARGVVHRDLKPENVLLGEDDLGQPRVKLVDFGIAKILEGEDGEARLTRTGMRFGTPRYMSPEQAGGGKVDARTDLYAVGLLLYEMLAGRPPFVAEDVASIMRMQVLSPPPPLPDTVPPALQATVMRLLAKSRKHRFATAKDTMSALVEVRADLVAAASPPVGAIAAATEPAANLPGVTTAIEGTWSANPSRRSGARVPLLVGGGLLLLLWAAAAIVAFTRGAEPVPTQAATTQGRAPAPEMPPEPPPIEAHASRVCHGDDCTFTCGDDCEARCKGPGDCVIDVGDGSSVACTGKGDCDVTCRGGCVVECRGRGDCDLRCVHARAPGPSKCKKKTLACGACP